MSTTIPIEEIGGSLWVNRGIEAGGKLDIHGSGRVRGNLTVGGWLDAAKVKGANKGIFVSERALQERYAEAEVGWFAGVVTREEELEELGLTLEDLGIDEEWLQGHAIVLLYVADDEGSWECTGKLYVVETDNGQIEGLAEEIADVRETLTEHRGYINRLSADMGNVLDTLDAQDAIITDLNTALDTKMDKSAVRVLSEGAYSILEGAGRIDAEKIYFVYEGDEEV